MRHSSCAHQTTLGSAFALLLLTACGGDENDGRDSAVAADSAANASAAASGTTPAGDEIDIEELHLGRALKTDSSVVEDMTDFRTGDTIYAVMETDANESGKQVVVRWTKDDNDQVMHEETRTVVTGEKARTVFRHAAAWAPGKYHVRIMYNGKETKSEDFEVK
ncbi:MAG TPA: hypothetical protein VE869_05645 [Gemmatimonas sp.]|nr:hypothetical protein [Gemmatimonas sp.]